MTIALDRERELEELEEIPLPEPPPPERYARVQTTWSAGRAVDAPTGTVMDGLLEAMAAIPMGLLVDDAVPPPRRGYTLADIEAVRWRTRREVAMLHPLAQVYGTQLDDVLEAREAAMRRSMMTPDEVRARVFGGFEDPSSPCYCSPSRWMLLAAQPEPGAWIAARIARAEATRARRAKAAAAVFAVWALVALVFMLV